MRQWKGWKKHFCPLVVGYFEHAFVILNKQSYAKTWKDLLLWSRHAYKIWYGKYQQTQPHPQGSQKLKSNRSWDTLKNWMIKAYFNIFLPRYYLFVFSLLFHSLWDWTSSGSWQLGQTGWRVRTCIPLSRGWWSASTAAPWWSGTMKHRSPSISAHLYKAVWSPPLIAR